ncbi:uncharacterized protein UMAG_02429 [Mycosarcoma maydis]|uniref:Uncharacterized protein n=1 Tax=Mycosarcoma maydis TaxID=5270 RepID=A0A0D1E6A9_MYCMD|nr:uncharacterized protein UMAG_02429 [Ustilago maydis 521]KIS69915.1 hypothetical protein UMAG_02429 [Ustilago maydis 521]|eukprot:XP_011388719.1 hypothetical protein UMAG_02429 [Ustilago maydis 521]
MAATSRRRSTHGLTSSGSSTQLARRGSSSRLGGARGRFDPSLMMSSNAAPSNGIRDRSPHAAEYAENDDDASAQDKTATRRGKSTDRLQRSRDSSSHLSGKRSKSYTHLGMTADDGTAARRRKATSKKGKSQRTEAEDGWTSASAENTPSDRSADASPSSSPGDEGLVLGIKKRPANPTQTATKNPKTTLPDPKKEPFPQLPDTPRASARVLEPENGYRTHETTSSKPVAPPAQLDRQDTSKTLVGGRNDDAVAAEVASRQAAPSRVMAETDSLDPRSSLVKLEVSPSSAKTGYRTAAPLELDPANHARHQRVLSNASNRTLRSSMPAVSSPSSVRSKSSVLSNRFPLFSREAQAAAPPMLDTHNALAGRLGARHEDRGDLLAPMVGPSRGAQSVSAMTSSTSAPVGLDQLPHASLVNRSNTLHKAGSSSALNSSAATSLSLSSVSQKATGTVGYGLQQQQQQQQEGRSAQETANDRRRTASTQSLTAADAAKLAAKLRLARDSMDDHGLGGYGSAQRGAQGYNPRLEQYKKPVVSTFVKNDASEAPQAIEVQANSVYSKMFSQAHDSQGGDDGGRRMIRYVMGYGISGPPIEKSQLSDALLGPNLDLADFESSWAPALAYAAGLGAAVPRGMQTKYALVTPEAPAAVGGPNSTPLHLIHGLTTTSPEPFPLDPTDVPALQEEADVFESRPVSELASIQLVDPGLIRAIAVTTHAIAVHRSHVVTRRYADPMRQALERVVRSSGRYVANCKTRVGNNTLGSAVASRWGRKSAPSSPAGLRLDTRPRLQSRTTSDTTAAHPAAHPTHTSASSNLAGQLYNLVDAAEHPVRSLKRVWSGGVARGGLVALTRTEEEP